MDELNQKIFALVRLRYEYFLQNPTTSQEAFKRELRRKAVQLIEVIDFSFAIYFRTTDV